MADTAKLPRGIVTIDALRLRSTVDPATHCWIWQGCTVHGSPRIWTAHLDDMVKRVLSGPRAVWYIAHGTPLGQRIAYMGCWNQRCVCPAHVRAAADRSHFTQAAARAGCFRMSQERRTANRANAAAARAAAGIVDTPIHLVQAVRDAAGTTTQREIARRLGLSNTIVSRIVRGINFQHLPQGAECEAPAA